jgi:hypothetical protein
MRSIYVPLFEMDDGIIGPLGYKRDLCASPGFRENGSGPRPRQMTASDKNDILHAVDTQASLLDEPHAVIDIFDYPLSEISESDSVLPFCWERKI